MEPLKNQLFDKISYPTEDYLLKHKYNTIIMSRCSYISFVYFFFTLILQMLQSIQQYYPFITPFMKAIFPLSDTRPTQVGDMDTWPVTWHILSYLIGWSQQILSTSW